MDLNKITISINASVIDVMKKIDSLPALLTVFVLDNEKVVGTITDGDIRRGLINGLSLMDSLSSFIFTNFSFIQEGQNNFSKLSEFRKRKLKAVPLLSETKQLIKVYDFTKMKSLLPVDAVIMAGGLGTRLLPLTKDTPKPLIKVANKEIISYNFDRLKEFGIVNQKITVNYLGNQIKDFCADYDSEINFEIIEETEYLGTAGSLALVDHFENDTVLLMNSDLLTNIDYEDFYQSFIAKDADIMVASIPYEVNLPYAILNAEDGKVSSFQEKPSYTYYANAGIYLMKKEVIKDIPKAKFYNATDLMDSIIEKEKKLIHYPIRGYWLDIGKHEDYDKAQKDIAHINWD